MPQDAHRPGTIAWHDLTVAEPAPITAFYRDVLGVVVDSVSMGDYSDYSLLPMLGADPIAGVCHARGRNADLPPVWLPYFVVGDLDVGLAACLERGGRVVAGPKSVGEGAYAVIEDPAGAACALWADTKAGAESGLDGDVEHLGAGEAVRVQDWMWGPGIDAAPLIEEVVLAGLVVASGGEGSIDSAELGTLMGCLKKRFRTVGADLQLEALVRAIERFESASVAEVSETVASLGRDLPVAGRVAIFSDLCSVAGADGSVHTMEKTLLRHIAEAWGIATEGIS